LYDVLLMFIPFLPSIMYSTILNVRYKHVHISFIPTEFALNSRPIHHYVNLRFDAFSASEYNEVFSGYQPGEDEDRDGLRNVGLY
jgi:hypothetical protein